MRTRHRFILLSALFHSLACASAQSPAAPTGLVATGFEQHIELRWQSSAAPNVTGYKIYRSADGGASFSFLKQIGNSPLTTDWTGDEGQNLTRHYRIAAVAGAVEGAVSATAAAETRPMSDEELLDMTQQATFRYFWDYAHPVSGLARERSNGDANIVTTGGSGFGIMALVVGAERGWVTREQAVTHMIKVVSFLQFADRFHGVFPHWMNGETGNVVPFSQYDNGGDLVETAFLMQGLLAARQYFDQDTPLEKAVRDVITSLWEDVEWDWYRRNGSNVLYWHWSPNFGWQMNFPLRGFNEAQIVYLLAAASPTHPVPASLYTSGWLSGNYKNNSIQFGLPVYCGPFGGGPLFFAHYSYLGFDPRNRKDAVCNYFVRNRNHALIHHAYCKANPENHQGYSADCWGLTASDNPWGYLAHSPWPADDNGTIAPTAALASMPYTPQESMAALRHFYRIRGERLWGEYGFRDAFNLDQNWFANSYLAIDQGPIVAMIENHRTGLFWRLFMKNPEIQPALTAVGFQSDASSTDEAALKTRGFDCHVFPNPVPAGGVLQCELGIFKQGQTLHGELLDLTGRPVRVLFANQGFPIGNSQHNWEMSGMAPGFYFLKIQNEAGATVARKVVVE